MVFLAELQPGDLMMYPESQTRQFRSFLVRANRYPSLLVGGMGECGQSLEKKIVAVEVSVCIYTVNTSICIHCTFAVNLYIL